MSEPKSALRHPAKPPGFTAIAVLTLALGIGFSVSSFSMANAFLLRTLPNPESWQLVRIFPLLRRMMPEMSLPGPWLLVTTILVLSGTVLLACWFPARRATRISPVEALRPE